MYESLINAVNDYIEETGIDSFDDIALSLHASEIFLDEKDFNFRYKYKRKYSINQCEKLVREFLSLLNLSYLEHFNMRKSDGTIIYDYSNPYETAYSCYNFEEERRVIYIPVTGTIEDAYSIVHELFHDINLDIEKTDSMSRNFFSECLSYLGELLFSDFLSSKGTFESKTVDNSNMFYMRRKALEVNFNLNLINLYLNNGYIDDFMIKNLIVSYPEQYIDDIREIIYFISSEEELTLEEEECYVLSSLVASYMYDRIKSDEKNLNELFDLNEVLSDYDMFQVLNYLGLDNDGTDLTESSYNLLRNNYKKFIRR